MMMILIKNILTFIITISKVQYMVIIYDWLMMKENYTVSVLDLNLYINFLLIYFLLQTYKQN